MIVVVDNYDSFTYNLVQYLGQVGASVRVFRNDAVSLAEIAALSPEGIMLSPGPCTPRESGICLDVIQEALSPTPGAFAVPVFGVCLGHQAIGYVTGAEVTVAGRIMHGKASPVQHDGRGVFEGLPNPFSAIRYHSLVITEATLRDDFVVTAHSTDDHEVMGIRHRTRPIEGVQFHPESILTEDGLRIVANFVRQTQLARAVA